MAQRLNTSFVSSNIPGSFFETKVQSSASGTGSTGVITIIGEADGGPDFSLENLKNNFFSPDQFANVQQKYLSGPIVEAFMALTSPSNDANITGAPNQVFIVKTNAGAKASAVITSYGTLSDKNYGVAGNKYNYQITQIDSEVGPSVTSSVLSFSTPSIYDGLAFSVRVNGSAATVVTLPTGSHSTIGALVSQIAGLLPAGLTCVAGLTANTLVINSVVDVAANAQGYSKSFELIDSVSGDLLALGLAAGVTKSSVEPKIELDINRSDIALNEKFVVAAEVAMNIGYVGTSCSLTISATNLTTTISGGAGANLNINLADFHTIKDLCVFINAQTGYTCSVVASSTSTPVSALDELSSVAIATSASVAAVGVKKSVYNFINALATSTKLDAVVTAGAGLPAACGIIYLSAGVKGATSSSSIVSGLLACEGIVTNFVIPLFSRDATLDIADGLTDSSSAYTIDAINASVKSHCLKMSTAKNKKHRSCFLSVWDSFVNSQTKSHELASARCSLAFQKASAVNSQGVVTNFLPWYAAVIAAGMQTAGFYKSITNKLANIISYTDPAGFDSGSIGDLGTAIDAGLLILQPDVAGVKWVVDQTTFGLDQNFVYNSISTMYNVDLVALDLSASLQRQFVGQSLADITISSVTSYIQGKMEIYKKSKLIAPSSDAANGYKNLSISIQGAVMNVAVEVKSSSALLFIPISLTISEISL